MIQGRGFWHFAREFIAHPRQTGALFPSSRALARRMAGQVPEGEGIVIELGPGLGSVTAALLARGVPAEQLWAIEYSPRLAAQLRQRFPGVNVIEGDARHLSRLIEPRPERIRAIVSSLPLRSLPKPTVHAIFGELRKVAAPSTVFVQFTYHFRSACSRLPMDFVPCHRSFVPLNLPPARVDAYCYQK
ncbi:class I SAM-dependent methyltransferase [Acidihalobacter prosperus]|uniref:Ribosomal RNA adenine methylase transferase N-terminal domain-containing protein n=1 Tax=Acidihalobacter prosperus TaxID=160660 RepID=A0A1A6C6M2_9GAMM|nr:methyltransferase domain-containing protein [Acidihalobacter prosperus]OBS10207.1 hypothetical protein Thpro_021257 [Acidihalobacter prosperus]